MVRPCLIKSSTLDVRLFIKYGDLALDPGFRALVGVNVYWVETHPYEIVLLLNKPTTSLLEHRKPCGLGAYYIPLGYAVISILETLKLLDFVFSGTSIILL